MLETQLFHLNIPVDPCVNASLQVRSYFGIELVPFIFVRNPESL